MTSSYGSYKISRSIKTRIILVENLKGPLRPAITVVINLAGLLRPAIIVAEIIVVIKIIVQVPAIIVVKNWNGLS